MFGISHMELLIVLGIALLLFGSRLPSVARSLGRSITEFKKGTQGIEDKPDEPNPNQNQKPESSKRS